MCAPLIYYVLRVFITKAAMKKKRRKLLHHVTLIFLHSIKLSTSSKARELREAQAVEGMSSSPEHQNHKHSFFYSQQSLPQICS